MTPLLILISRIRIAHARRLHDRSEAIYERELAFWERRLGRRI
jgi:hypothetical protein